MDESAEAVRRLQVIPDRANADPWLMSRGRLLSEDIHIGVGDRAFILAVRDGRIVSIEPAKRLMRPWAFSITASAPDWLAHWQAEPRPGWHDILAMAKMGRLEIGGNLVPLLQHLQYMKDVLALPRAPV